MLTWDDFTTIAFERIMQENKSVCRGVLTSTLSLEYDTETNTCVLYDALNGYVDDKLPIQYILQPDAQTFVLVYTDKNGRLILCDIDDYLKVNAILLSKDWKEVKVEGKGIDNLILSDTKPIRCFGR